MASSTLRTVMGFFRSVARRRIPMLGKDASLPAVFNYLPVSDRVITSGQPSESQLVEIVNAGFHTVINLAPTSMLENSVVDERRILEDCGANYIHIPVDFQNPTEVDFRTFTEHMAEHRSEQVWVHCAANMRVSAFMYRYRQAEWGHTDEEARQDLLKIWEPFGVWKEFVKR